MQLRIATPEKIVFEGEADDLLFNAEKGQLNVLERHANLVTFLQAGEFIVKNKGSEVDRLEVSEGVLKVEEDDITVLVPSAVSKNS